MTKLFLVYLFTHSRRQNMSKMAQFIFIIAIIPIFLGVAVRGQQSGVEWCATAPDHVAQGFTNGTCFRFFSSENLAREPAKTRCANFMPGVTGDLAIIPSQFAQSTLYRNLLSKGAPGNYWIGARGYTSPEWRWSDGRPLDNLAFTNWALGNPPPVPDKPSVDTNKFCAFVHVSDPALQWQVDNCGAQKQFICEYKQAKSRPDGYQFVALSYTLDWYSAEVECQREGGQLLDMSSADQLATWRNLTIQMITAAGGVANLAGQGAVWLGLNRQIWLWDAIGKEVAWSNFSTASLATAPVQECVYLSADIDWVVTSCDLQVSYLCQFTTSTLSQQTTTTAQTTTSAGSLSTLPGSQTTLPSDTNTPSGGGTTTLGSETTLPSGAGTTTSSGGSETTTPSGGSETTTLGPQTTLSQGGSTIPSDTRTTLSGGTTQPGGGGGDSSTSTLTPAPQLTSPTTSPPPQGIAGPTVAGGLSEGWLIAIIVICIVCFIVIVIAIILACCGSKIRQRMNGESYVVSPYPPGTRKVPQVDVAVTAHPTQATQGTATNGSSPSVLVANMELDARSSPNSRLSTLYAAGEPPVDIPEMYASPSFLYSFPSHTPLEGHAPDVIDQVSSSSSDLPSPTTTSSSHVVSPSAIDALNNMPPLPTTASRSYNVPAASARHQQRYNQRQSITPPTPPPPLVIGSSTFRPKTSSSSSSSSSTSTSTSRTSSSNNKKSSQHSYSNIVNV